MQRLFRKGIGVVCNKCGGNVMLEFGDYPEAKCLQCGWPERLTDNEKLIAESMNHIPNYVKVSK